MSPRAALQTGRAGAAAPSQASPSLTPGDLIGGKYLIDARIAEGGMGIVLRATHVELDRPVAIKLIRPEHAANEDVVTRLLAEARIAAGLRSKHVNHVLDVGRTETGVPYLVLEYMEGSDVCSYLARRGQLPVSEAVDLIMQACEALAEAHALGIVHRDLKPENLFLSEEADGGFVLKVFDFGISKAPAHLGSRALTNPSELVGSPSYMSPEQIEGGSVDARSDIWALGVLLYELCSGTMLFEAPSIGETFSKILNPQAALPALEVGPNGELLQRVIARCLRRNADDRYQDVVELARELAPLGTDALQAARVAKVAAAARARAIAAAGDAPAVMQATPLALTTTQLEIEARLAERTPGKRHRHRYMVVTVAALALLGAGSGYLTHRAAARARTAVVPAVVAVEQGRRQQPPTPVTLDTPAPASFALSAIPSPPSTAPQPTRPRPSVAWRGSAPSPAPRFTKPQRPTVSVATRSPVLQPVASRPAVLQPVASKPAEPAPPAPTPLPTADAWDPKSFGGRR
jgi:eukaryotic-like serine/threonine-protein kinase